MSNGKAVWLSKAAVDGIAATGMHPDQFVRKALGLNPERGPLRRFESELTGLDLNASFLIPWQRDVDGHDRKVEGSIRAVRRTAKAIGIRIRLAAQAHGLAVQRIK